MNVHSNTDGLQPHNAELSKTAVTCCRCICYWPMCETSDAFSQFLSPTLRKRYGVRTNTSY